MPCSDAHAENDYDHSLVGSVTVHALHLDTCSPFCFCDCCHTVFRPEFYYFNTTQTVVIKTLRCLTSDSGYKICLPFWRPPKFNRETFRNANFCVISKF
jgi:hypothetical protein